MKVDAVMGTYFQSCVRDPMSQDFEEMSSQDLADSIQEMHVKKRCVSIAFFMAELRLNGVCRQLQ